MANATDIVKKGVVRRTDEFITRSSATLASETRFWPNAMVGTTVGGYLAKFDDTQLLTFAGVVRNDQGAPLLPAGTAGDGTLDLPLQQPQRFELAVAGVAVTDIGRRVYALDDQTGTLSAAGTTFANLVGVVVDVVASGIALVEPRYDRPVGNELRVASADGANRAYRQYLENRISVDLPRSWELREAMRETDQLYQLWDNVRDARCEFYYVTVRRQALKRLREAIGPQRYYSASLPPYVPVWRFQPID